MPIGLSVDDVTKVDISLQPIAVPTRNFGALGILGTSDVIDTNERMRQYSTLDQVAADFGTSAPEWLAADLFFSQDPKPSILYLARWASTATHGRLNGAVFSPAQQVSLITSLQAVTTGAITLSVDGTPVALTGLNFSSITNLNGAATLLANASSTVVWNSALGRFEITSHTTGSSSVVNYATNPGSGAQLATLLGLTNAAGASTPVTGIPAEEPIAAVQALSPLSGDIYGMMFAATLTDDEHLAVAAYLEGASPSHIYGITIQNPDAIDSTSDDDLGALLKLANYSRTFWQYSTSSPYAVASVFGRAFTVDFTANNTVITLMFKQEPGVTAELLTETQAQTLKDKNGNVFVRYMNGRAIIQNGVMANGFFFDERHGTDWLQNDVQTGVFNLLYTVPTKIPQTDEGIHQITTTVEESLARGVNNGMIAPGVWTSPYQFGTLKRGMTLSKGYYVYQPPVALQAQADREARKAPTLQCAIKLAGAVHSAHVVINVNR